MSYVAQAEAIREGFVGGTIPVCDLLLHLEPLLLQVASDPETSGEARTIVNAIERTIFTEPEPGRSRLLGDHLDAVIAFVRASQPRAS
jgi:hypothetical protein